MEKDTCEYCLYKVKQKDLMTLICKNILCRNCINFLMQNQFLTCPFCLKPLSIIENLSKKNTSYHNSMQELGNLELKLSSQKLFYLSKLKEAKLINELFKLSEICNQIKIGDNPTIYKVLQQIKDLNLFELTKLNPNLLDIKEFHSLIQDFLASISGFVLQREKSFVVEATDVAWLGDILYYFSLTTKWVQHKIKITSKLPIIIQAFGVGLSCSSDRSVISTKLRIVDENNKILNSYRLKKKDNLEGRISAHYNLHEYLILDSGVKYNFQYKVKSPGVYALKTSQPIIHNDYAIKIYGGTFTFYFVFLQQI